MPKLKVPIKPYLLKFINMEMGMPLPSPEGDLPEVNVSAQTLLGAYLYALVEPMDRPYRCQSETYIILNVPDHDPHGRAYDARSSHLGIRQANITRFNRMAEDLFNYKLFYKLEQKEENDEGKRRSGKKKQVIEEIIQKYSTCLGELTYPMLKQRHDRWKEKGETLTQSWLNKIL